MLDAAETLEDVPMVPENRLGALVGDRRGQHSIGINEQWRIYLVWSKGAAVRVEIVDYH